MDHVNVKAMENQRRQITGGMRIGGLNPAEARYVDELDEILGPERRVYTVDDNGQEFTGEELTTLVNNFQGAKL